MSLGSYLSGKSSIKSNVTRKSFVLEAREDDQKELGKIYDQRSGLKVDLRNVNCV